MGLLKDLLKAGAGPLIDILPFRKGGRIRVGGKKKGAKKGGKKKGAKRK